MPSKPSRISARGHRTACKLILRPAAAPERIPSPPRWPAPAEFRAIFRATDSLDAQIQLLGDGTDPVTVAQRNSLEQKRDDAIKLALGPDRFQQYEKLQDPLYRQAMAAAIQSGSPGSAD